ncbi:MAG TPA: phosphoribosyl transferase, partial [Sphaerochaeta sp.]|nr:phosphoribosyl transferase [Sphaerochaeta sp.]
MVIKEFISCDMIRDSALKLAHKMYKQDRFVPDIIYASLRGGAYMANVFSEYYKMVRIREQGRPVFYAAVVARSYGFLRSQTNVMVDGWTYSPEHLRTGDKILLVDDIFDTGKTVNALEQIIMQKGIPRE